MPSSTHANTRTCILPLATTLALHPTPPSQTKVDVPHKASKFAAMLCMSGADPVESNAGSAFAALADFAAARRCPCCRYYLPRPPRGPLRQPSRCDRGSTC